MEREALDRLAKVAVQGVYNVHTAIGPGLLESVYCACLAIELREAGLLVEAEVPLPLVYKGQKIADIGYRIDLLVERELILEVKSVTALAPVHFAQLLSYLRLSDRRLGLLVNFNVARISEGGIKRIANKF